LVRTISHMFEGGVYNHIHSISCRVGHLRT
jgi:hypothetical protein